MSSRNVRTPAFCCQPAALCKRDLWESSEQPCTLLVTLLRHHAAYLDCSFLAFWAIEMQLCCRSLQSCMAKLLYSSTCECGWLCLQLSFSTGLLLSRWHLCCRCNTWMVHLVGALLCPASRAEPVLHLLHHKSHQAPAAAFSWMAERIGRHCKLCSMRGAVSWGFCQGCAAQMNSNSASACC